MPGEVSVGYDPEFGTVENADLVAKAVRATREKIDKVIKSPPRYILDVATGPEGQEAVVTLTEKDLRLIRYCLARTSEEIS